MNPGRQQFGHRRAGRRWWGAAIGGALVVAGLAFGARAVSVGRESPAAVFDTANKLYAEGKYGDAAATYEKLRATGLASPALDFNLGNALFKSGQIGRAIAAYREVERVAPRDPDLQANLQFARNQVEGPHRAVSRWRHWFGRLTLNEWALLTAAAFWLFFLLLAAGQARPAWKPRLRTYVMMMAGTSGVLVVCLVLALRSDLGRRTAIVRVREVVARSSPFDESQSAFTAHDGAEFDVLDAKNNWLQVSDGAKHIGWLKRESVCVFGAPIAGPKPGPGV